MHVKRFLLSGGWGYQNLGDYAILLALLKRLRELCPTSEIVVTSFDPEESKKIVSKYSVLVIPSFHRLLWGDHPYKELSIYEKTKIVRKPDSGVIVKILERLQSKVYAWISSGLNKKNTAYLDNLEKLPNFDIWQDVDCFILVGGGYFNHWQGCFLSHIFELACAQRFGVASLALGPTFGPFEDTQLPLVKKYLKGVDVVARDEKSIEELANIGVVATLIPDLALADVFCTSTESENVLLFVPGDLPVCAWDVTLDTIADFSIAHDLQVKIVVTRLYALDVHYAEKMEGMLNLKGVSVSKVVSRDYFEILSALMAGRLIVSWNLHGLIMAWRAGVPGICLNKGRKFASFMKQTSQEKRMVPWDSISSVKLYEALNDAYSQKVVPLKFREKFSQRVAAQIDENLKNVIKYVNTSEQN